MQEDAINVFCLSHGVSFPTLGSNRLVICKENHVLSYNFPHSGRWFYCCLCQKYWVAPKGDGGDTFSKQCPSCNLIKKARYYSCDQCNVTMIDSLGAINRKGTHITPWGTPHPHCPGCHQLPKSVPQSHACPELNALLTTARAQCPFCEGQERVEGGVVVVDRGESKNAAGAPRTGSAGEVGAPDPSYLDLEELERKASAIKALEAEAEAKAQERLRQVEARLRQEMSRRSELERKSQQIEEELKRQPEIEQSRVDQSHLEAVRITSEAAARFEEEREARIAAEQAKAEAEAKLLEMGVRASEAEERFRQAEAGIQQEASKRALAEERVNEVELRLTAENARIKADANEVETRLTAENAKIKADANEVEARLTAENQKIKADSESKIQAVGAEARRIEDNYKVEIEWIRGELEEAVAAARQAEEKHRAEITRITFEAESRAQQAETNARQYQIKVEEAISSAQAAMFNLEETQKKLDEAEAKYRETETRALQAETRSHRLYQILKLSSTFAEEAISENINAANENEKDAVVISLDHARNTYLDFPVETPGSDANGSTDYGDYTISDRMKALFQAAARANANEDKSGKVGNGEW
jgi:hypothetical protein